MTCIVLYLIMNQCIIPCSIINNNSTKSSIL